MTALNDDPDGAYVGLDTRVGDDVVLPGLSEHLKHYYVKCGMDDKAKCLELLTSLQLSEEIRKAAKMKYPQGSMGQATSREVNRWKHKGSNFYQTTYKNEFPLKCLPSPITIRPCTSLGFTSTLKDASGSQKETVNTTYNEGFCRKDQRPTSSIHNALSSGHRAKRPHPQETWKFPSNADLQIRGTPLSQQLTDEKIHQLHKYLCQSTYQMDFLGLPQGFSVSGVFNAPCNWKSKVPYSRDSSQRSSYQHPQQLEELKLSTTRYGCNRSKASSTKGIIPSPSAMHMHLRPRTTYDQHFNNFTPGASSLVHIRDIGRRLGAESLQRYYDQSAKEDEKEQVRGLLHAYQQNLATTGQFQQDLPQTHAPSTPPMTTQGSHWPIESCVQSSLLRESPSVEKTNYALMQRQCSDNSVTLMSPAYSPPLFLG